MTLLQICISPPRPSRYDAETRHFRSQHDGLVSRREKGSSHSYEEAEPLRRSGSDVDNEFVGSNWTESACEHGSKEYDSKISLKLSTAKASTPYLFPYMYTSFEEEEVCPTCLEEYTEENPKIITKCSHHFHLVAYMSGWREVKVVLFVARYSSTFS
ncbi:hypothetical protein Leryth_013723 [Lithospermum erythrorhizon]|nr:hypothetical protein Leryth_013723 [Lithospermum erythrorhizon]